MIRQMVAAVPFWLWCYLASCVLWFIGVGWGCFLSGEGSISSTRTPIRATAKVFMARFVRWDADAYVSLATEGYSYDPEVASDVAFFPAYPLTIRAAALATGISPSVVALLISHGCVLLAMRTFAAYLRGRYPILQREQRNILLAFAIFPTTFFFRLPYTQSMFLLVVLLVFVAMQRRCPAVASAAPIGLATAIKLFGVAMVLPLLMCVARDADSWQRKLGRATLVAAISCWGLIAFMLFQAIEFGDAFAFAQTQENFRMRPDFGHAQRIVALSVWEPIWSVYDPGSHSYWRRNSDVDSAALSLTFANPIYFVACAIAILVGARSKVLDAREVAFSLVLLALAYLGPRPSHQIAGEL